MSSSSTRIIIQVECFDSDNRNFRTVNGSLQNRHLESLQIQFFQLQDIIMWLRWSICLSFNWFTHFTFPPIMKWYGENKMKEICICEEIFRLNGKNDPNQLSSSSSSDFYNFDDSEYFSDIELGESVSNLSTWSLGWVLRSNWRNIEKIETITF